MSETVTTFKLDSPEVAIPMDRDEFYREQIQEFKNNGKPSRAVGIVDIFLFDIKGELFVQKRSDGKAHNAGMFDKSLGGHIQFGDSPNYTTMVESVQELQVPSITLNSEEDFIKTYGVLEEYLDTIAVVRLLDEKIGYYVKMIHGEKIVIANKKHLYIGIYDGSTKTVDREAKGVILYTLEDLKKEIKANPNLFTHDLAHYLNKYEDDMKKTLKKLKVL